MITGAQRGQSELSGIDHQAARRESGPIYITGDLGQLSTKWLLGHTLMLKLQL